MDVRDRLDLARIRVGFSKRVSELSRNAPIAQRLSGLLSQRFRNGALGIACLVVSGALAWNAQELVFAQALRHWEQTRAPSERVWDHSLSARGFAPLADPKRVHRALRKLPATLDQPSSVWTTPDSSWIVVFRSADSPIPEKIYCRDCKKLPERFDPLGVGWQGFDGIMERLERTRTASPPQGGIRKESKFRDPREIHY